MSFDPMKDLKVELDERGLSRKVTCIPCAQVIFDLPPNPTDAERLVQGKAHAAHLEFAHEMEVWYGRCQDPSCGRFHLSAFQKGKMPLELRRRRNQG